MVAIPSIGRARWMVRLALLTAVPLLPSCQTPRPPPAPLVQRESLPPGLEALRQKAEAGDANAARALGSAFENGRGVPQDYAAALWWYDTGAKLGSPSAMYDAGLLYDNGRGVPIDRTKAAAYYESAAAKGYGRAEYRLAMLYETGEGVKRDRAEAIRLYRSAAAHGMAKAQRRLAALEGKTPGEPPAVSFGQAQDSMLTEGVAAGNPQALHHLEEAAQKSDGLAQYDLGYFYENGIGLPADKVKAYVWYKRAAAAGGPQAAKTAAERGAQTVGARLSPEERSEADALLAQPLAARAPQ